MRQGRINWATGATEDVPTDGLEKACQRLSFVAGVAVVIAIVSLAMSFLRQDNLGARVGTERPIWVIVAGLVASVVMASLARVPRLRASARLDLGLGYLVVMCALGSVFRHALPYHPADVVRGVSATVPALVFFAILVPLPPVRLTVAAVLAVLTDPAALALAVAQGDPMPPANLWLWLFAPNVVAVVLAAGTARVVHTLRQEVARARELGSYRLVERIGAGGMGEVWRAEHRMLARPAAIKLIRPSALEGDSRDAVERARMRFEREAQRTATLASPHTIEVYDFGEAQDGSFYYVMELLDGGDLRALLTEENVLTPARTIFLLRQLCHSLRDAHEAGFVHRDIKPANVFLCRRGTDHDYVKVLDFGLVKRFRHEEEAPETIGGAIAGTPGYMAPEVIAGEPEGPGVDIYAVGCLAYRMLAGRDVFVADDWIPLLMAHANKVPPALDEVATQPIPARLTAIVMCCLEKNPAHRFESVQALMASLDVLAAEHPWSSEQAATWWATRSTHAAGPAGVDPTGPTVAAEG